MLKVAINDDAEKTSLIPNTRENRIAIVDAFFRSTKERIENWSIDDQNLLKDFVFGMNDNLKIIGLKENESGVEIITVTIRAEA